VGPTEPGTYILLLRCTVRRSLEVGRLGVLHLEPGYYAYVGSALGPGGLEARLGRHLGGSGRTHWHIDYLRAHAKPIEAWYCRGASRREHLWSEALRVSAGASIPLSGFGASDCRCESHIFFFARRPSRAAFEDRLRRQSLLEGRLWRWSRRSAGLVRAG
jgi:Uri superfamily endonuclease